MCNKHQACCILLLGGLCRYANGDDYQGYFQSGQRFGHGVLQQGRHLSSYASIYVGEWLNDKRQGYGVQDDILKGIVTEKNKVTKLFKKKKVFVVDLEGSPSRTWCDFVFSDFFLHSCMQSYPSFR